MAMTSSASVSFAGGAGTGAGAGAGAGAASTTQAASASEHKAEGMVTIDLGRPAELGHSPVDVLADAIEAHDIPESDHFELFQKIRLAMLLPDAAARRQLIVCRLLALATYAHTCPESKAATQLFLYEPDVVPRTAALVDPARKLPQDIVSSALYALDALGRYKSRLAEVLAALNTSVNHGILLHLLRQLIDDLATGAPASSEFFVDALYGILSFVTSTSNGNSMVVGAGLVQLLVALVKTGRTDTYMVQRSVTRAIGLIDTVIYTNPHAFTIYCQAQGPDVFVGRIEHEVQADLALGASQSSQEDSGIGSSSSSSSGSRSSDDKDAIYGRLSFGKANLLRQYLKSITHMMSTAGTADGLRNLIDGSLPASIKTMMEHRRVFGPQVVAYAINVMATFVHNEPTSLAVVQEKKLPEAFVRFVEDDIEASYDVICAIPNAVGALCLNQAGWTC
ncbi:hypothetical protein L7F22_066440 [Adiantum nelumboides]|nr:hypothetical protein [Adiantum nelumboides]